MRRDPGTFRTDGGLCHLDHYFLPLGNEVLNRDDGVTFQFRGGCCIISGLQMIFQPFVDIIRVIVQFDIVNTIAQDIIDVYEGRLIQANIDKSGLDPR